MSSHGAVRLPELALGPHRVEVPAPASRELPGAPTALQVVVAGAGREMDLAEFLALTASTSLLVLVDGVLVHEQYFEGTTAEGALVATPPPSRLWHCSRGSLWVARICRTSVPASATMSPSCSAPATTG